MAIRVVMVLAIAVCACAAVAQEAPSVDIPVYPGGETVMEVNVGQAELMPFISAAITLGGGAMKETMEAVELDEVAEALRDVRRIQFLQVNVLDAGAYQGDIANFYQEQLPAGGWSRVFWSGSGSMGRMAVYIKPDASEIYGFRVSAKNVDGQAVKRVEAAWIEGRIDFTKLLGIAGKLFLKGKVKASVGGNAPAE